MFHFSILKLNTLILAVFFTFFLSFTGAIGFGAEETAAAERKILDCSWCAIDYPEKAVPGEIFFVKVTPKKIPEGQKIGGDLHYAKVGQYLGYASWGGEPKKAKSGETLTFRYRMPEFETEDKGVQPIYFLTVKGWEEAKEKAFGPVILPLINDEIRKRFKPDSATLKKSWIAFGKIRGASGGDPVWKSGEKIIIPVEYYVDPEDDWGKTEIVTWVLGPWIDCPDGKYATGKKHLGGNCGIPNTLCEIGKRVKTEWTLTLPKAYADSGPEKGKMGDSLLLVTQFRGRDGKNWPWQLRKGLPVFERNGGFFDLDTPVPGNLFTLDEPVILQVIPTETGKNLQAGKIHWKVRDISGKNLASGTADFPPANGQKLEIPINLKQRGTFLFHAELPQKEIRETTFARIPNIEKLAGTRSTCFGGQKFFGDEEAVQAARRLGMSSCRVWLNWQNLEPGRGIFNEEAWNELEKNLKMLNENHIRPWLLLDGVPPWAIQNPQYFTGKFTALPVADEDIDRFVTRAAKRLGRWISGFEWLNEIVPGNVCEDPIADYVRFCQTANAASKRVNPNFQNQIAGGLWPQTFRQNLISAGILEFTDILSIHYGNGGSVRGAKRDLASSGAEKRVAVWDNESAYGISTWGMPLSEAMKQTAQSDYFFTRFPDELLAGCEKIVLFGGESSPAGDWSHFWSDHSPRPSAAALAVLIHALTDAVPLGEFSIGKNDSLKLFERPGRPMLLVVSSLEKGGEVIRLQVGKKKITQIDQQGNETELKPDREGKISLRLTESPFLIEGGDPNALKANLAVSFAGTSAVRPTFTGVSGNTLEIPLRIKNTLNKPVKMSIFWDSNVPGKSSNLNLSNLDPGETRSLALKINELRAGLTPTRFTIRFSDSALPVLSRKIIVNAVKPDEIGNLLKNPGFEFSEHGNDSAAMSWNGSGKEGKRLRLEDPDSLGHENFVCKFEKTGGKYFHISQNVPKLPTTGGEYVYGFWIRSNDLTTGSNFGGKTDSGENWDRHWLQVFQAPRSQPVWQVFSKRLELPPGTQSVTAAPVCQGEGWAMIDNTFLVPYEGTEFCAFAPEANKITINGDLSDFDRSAPIPLLGQNQLRVLNKYYRWSPQNCSGCAYFNYDEEFLYVGIEVLDNIHSAPQTGAECANHDSVRIAFHPLNRLPGEDDKAFCFDLSSAAPGGSGKHTIYRPKELSGGLRNGSLAKDSSVFDISIQRIGNRTFYEAALPWSELGGPKGTIGTKLGLSMKLTDHDGKKTEAFLLWGEGLSPAWSPVSFGMLTLTNKKEKKK